LNNPRYFVSNDRDFILIDSKPVSHRHHYVPQFYLREWRDEDRKGVWLYKRNTANQITLRRRSPKSIGYVEDLYSLKPETKWPVLNYDADAIEKNFFSLIDDAAASVHQKLISSGVNSLSSQDRLDWALFLNSLIERNPKRISEVEQGYSGEEIKQQLIERWGKSEVFENIDISAIQHNAIRSALAYYIADGTFVSYIANMRWATIQTTIEDEHFLTGDTPLLVNGGMAGNPIHLLSIALSPQKLMILHTDSEEFDEDFLRRLSFLHNIGIVDITQKYLISSRELKDAACTKYLKAINERLNTPSMPNV
jgi:hypothetical protein